MPIKTVSFRVGRVRVYRRGRVWYLAYYEQGKRRQPRVGPDRAVARRLAAEINGQLEVGVPSALRFEPIPIGDLRQRWLNHHESVRRSSLHTIRRYRSATEHLLAFLAGSDCRGRVSDFRPQHAEEFVSYLRDKWVTPNGHPKARRRQLQDAGIKFILETCGALFNFAARQRHLPPYADNPFRVIEVSRMPVEDVRPVVALRPEQEQQFLEACDDWQFPIFLTFLAAGLRPGELVHLLIDSDLDLETGWLRIRNKALLGWQVKTRNERDIPLIPVVESALRQLIGSRRAGPLFLQRRCQADYVPPLTDCNRKHLEQELERRCRSDDTASQSLTRVARLGIAMTIWRDLGALKEDYLRKEFMRITRRLGWPEITAPKTLRHTFATALQDANVDPLIRNELMGHVPAAMGPAGTGLGMTSVYTHTRPETKRRQLEAALADRPAIRYAEQRLACLK